MARKPITSNTPTPSPKTKAAPAPIRTEVRNTPVPRAGATASAAAAKTIKKQVTMDMIARRAYEIYQSGQGGSEFDNWIRAERELRG
jgi:hypothetical protein